MGTSCSSLTGDAWYKRQLLGPTPHLFIQTATGERETAFLTCFLSDFYALMFEHHKICYFFLSLNQTDHNRKVAIIPRNLKITGMCYG